MFLYPLSKDSQWETAKAGYKNANFGSYDASHKTCFGVISQMLICIGVAFLFVLIFGIRACFLCKQIVIHHRKTQLW